MTEADPADSAAQIRALERRLVRERKARQEAESIAEQATRQLYDTVQELVRSSRMSDLLGDIAVHANFATTVAEAIAGALARVCAFAGWPIGHALLPSPDEPTTLQSSGIWYLGDEQRFTGFRGESASVVFTIGEGLPGRVLQTGAPAWIADVREDPGFVRASLAARHGIVAAFAVPVLVRNETAAVLEFFSPEAAEPDESMLRVVGFVGAQLGRVMEREAAEERLTRLALYDGLTGLPNRMLLMDRLKSSLVRARRRNGRVDVIYVDVDDFKTINDSRGHGAGDEVLRALSARLQDAVRSSDTVALAAPWTLARLGGDEFAVVLDDCDDLEQVAMRIEAVLRAPLQLADAQVFVSVSMGTASIPLGPGELSAEALLGAANVAMHEAKRAGKARHIAFEPRMQDEARRRQELGDHLHRAVDEGEFELCYQPVVDLADGRVIGAEALIRWRHPGWGLVAPNDFVSRAEETGLIVPMGSWVLQEACRQAREWQRTAPRFTIAVNVSGRQLREPGFVRTVHEAVSATGLSPDTLCLEMTESILMERDDEAIAKLNQLRANGVHLAIDDFGTGYSSLAALRRLPVDLLKIDRSFVASLPDDEDAGTIAWAVVRLGHTLGMQVLAEGVETAPQRDQLFSFGCDQAQGYLFGRPSKPADFPALTA